MDVDLSQIEFRLIASAIGNERIIAQYNKDPKTDFHSMVADMAGIERGPGKTLNFTVGFGAGKKRTISVVKNSLDISSVGYQESGMAFDDYCQQQAESMYEKYHRLMPELNPTKKRATKIARERGYISNLYGRHRRLPSSGCYKAFNAYIQSSAADLAKDLTLQIAAYLRSLPGGRLAWPIGVVHDSWILYVHKSIAVAVGAEIQRIIEYVSPPIPVKVPILSDVKISDKNWKECC